MVRYKEYFNKMLEENTEAFEIFRSIHAQYAQDSSFQEAFNEAGRPILELVRDYEDRLCRQSEGSGHGMFAGNLAEKFWGEIRKEFPMIDRVGIIVKNVNADVDNSDDFEINKIETFELKKISLNSR